MESLRWLRLAPLAVVIAAGALASGRAVSGAGAGPLWDPPPCSVADTGGPPGPGAWYRLDPVLDRSGTLAARRLTTGIAGQPPRQLDLAPESFASGPVGGLVLTGEDDGAVSRLRLLDPARACATAVVDEPAVVRSAVLDPDGRSIIEHRVDRTTRADLGVWRHTIGGPAVRVLDGLGLDAELGPTFSTDLVVAMDGRLVVSSCALETCRVRVLDPATGEVALLRGTGSGLGVTGGSAVVRAACPGFPCPIEAIDLATGRRATLVERAGAALLGGPAGSDLIYEDGADRVAVLGVATGRRIAARDLGGIPLRTGSTATSGAEAPPGRVALAPRGRPAPTTMRVFDPLGGSSEGLAEASR
jgi:hypothetical protein